MIGNALITLPVLSNSIKMSKELFEFLNLYCLIGLFNDFGFSPFPFATVFSYTQAISS